MITGLEPFVIKWTVAHAAPAIHAKVALWTGHPLSAAAHTTANMAIHKGVTYGVTSVLTNPAVPAVSAIPHVHIPVATAVLGQGATGPAAAAPTPAAVWHAVAKAAEMAGIPVGSYLFRKTELYQQAKEVLSDLFEEVKGVKDLSELKDLLSERAILARIRDQIA